MIFTCGHPGIKGPCKRTVLTTDAKCWRHNEVAIANAARGIDTRHRKEPPLRAQLLNLRGSLLDDLDAIDRCIALLDELSKEKL